MGDGSADILENSIAIIEAELRRLKSNLPIALDRSLDTLRNIDLPDVNRNFMFNDGCDRPKTCNDGYLRGKKRGPEMPDPRLIKLILKNRERRDKHFNADLFADPAWDMILDLIAAREEHRRISISSLCVAARVPPSTALRWVNILIKKGVIERISDPSDKRRAFVRLSENGARSAAAYFEECEAKKMFLV
ncbi:MAG: winged helix DNA-binding protein [Pontixanthobacter sp.]